MRGGVGDSASSGRSSFGALSGKGTSCVKTSGVRLTEEVRARLNRTGGFATESSGGQRGGRAPLTQCTGLATASAVPEVRAYRLAADNSCCYRLAAKSSRVYGQAADTSRPSTEDQKHLRVGYFVLRTHRWLCFDSIKNRPRNLLHLWHNQKVHTHRRRPSLGSPRHRGPLWRCNEPM